ncbi:MAG: serine hydroxymethyltransferase [Dehalococcoidia bacterium]|nr:serine hydroxymethyltransferase [Dehalococcoidia bacterium]
MSNLWRVDRAVAFILKMERERQNNTVNLIASENYVSPAVLEAQGSVMTNKYAEGYPGHRYYGGCQYVDEVESLAIQRAKQLFNAEHANVQAHSGSQANMAAFFSLLKPGDKIMGMSLAHGGHLTHGSPVNFSGQLFQFIPYGVDKQTELINYSELEQLAQKHRPKLIIAGYSAYSQILDFPKFQSIATGVGAKLMVDMAHIAGLVAAGLHPAPIPYADIVTSTTHKTLRGPRGGLILCNQELGHIIDSSIFPGLQGGPLEHIVAAKAVAFNEALKPKFVTYQQAVLDNASLLADLLQKAGLRIVSGSTKNHMFLADLTPMGITGRAAEEALEKSGIIANRNAIPFDTRPPQVASGLRFGTPAITTRGFGSDEVQQVADFIIRVLTHLDDHGIHEEIRQEVEHICKKFPIPGYEG